ncbi:G patch domain-containing protein 11 [Trebouxia sp. C0009 RCD-2024]
MLAAMGYQHGQGLGKGQSGRAAPVPIQVKGGKHGLGIEENKKRKQQQVQQQQQERVRKRTHLQQEMQAEHQVTSAVRAANRRAESQLVQARQVCETLDRRKGVESSEMWPPATVVPDADVPPVSSDVHTGSADAEDNEEASQDSLAWEDWPVQAKLAMVLDYLRQSYHYCIFCGCQYTDAEDLLANCPGLQEDDH